MVASHHDVAELTAAEAVTATSLRKSQSAGGTSKDHFAADRLPKSAAAAAGSQPSGCLRKRPRTDSSQSHLLAGPNAEYDSDPAAATPSAIYISRLRRSISISKFVEKRTKKIRLYRNGDRFFSGMMFVVSLEYHRTFISLLVDLTDSVICDRKLMPFGVRYLFEIDTGRRVTSLEQLEEGNCYVCSTSPVYRHIDYLGIGLQPLTRRNWHTTDDCLWFQPSARRRDRTPECVLSGRGPTTTATQAGDFDAANLTFVRPRIVTIIRNGSRPRRTVRVLLNRKTAQTYEQVLTEISEAIKLDSGAVKRIYSFDGKQVTSLYDFFRDDNIFIAFGCERPTFNDFDLTEREASNITMTCMRSCVRQQRSFTPRSSRPANNNGDGGRKLKSSFSARSINAIAADKNSAVDDVICSPTIIVPIRKPDNQSKQTHQPTVIYRSNPALSAEPPHRPSGSRHPDSGSENLSEDVITDSSTSNMFSASSGVTVRVRSASSVLPSSSLDRSSPAVTAAAAAAAAAHIFTSSSVSPRSSTPADTKSPTASVTTTPSPNPSPRTNPNRGSLAKVAANSETPRAWSVVRPGRPSTSRAASPAAAAATTCRKTPTNGRDKLKQKTATLQAAQTNTAKDSCKSQSTGGVRSRKATLVNRILAGTAGGDHNLNEPKNLRTRYKIGKVIGQGNFAIVKECTEKARNLRFALKIIDKSKCRGTEQKIENEVAILRRLRHPNVIQLVDDFDTPDYLYMIMELITGGDLFESITEAIKYTERDASSMMYHIACAVNYLHSLNIVHRDIKPENLLVHQRQDGTKLLKLGDFGLATYVSRPLYTVCGTLTYVAPEILTEVGYGLKVDIWSVGVIAYILLCGFAPFASDRRDDLIKQIMCGTFEFVVPYWNDISTPAKELIKHLLEVDVDKRFSAKQLLEYPWVAEDTAEENDLHHVIVNRRAEAGRIVLSNSSSSSSNHSSNVICGIKFKSNRLPLIPRQAGVAILAVTALDKGFEWSPTANSSLSSHLSE